MARGIKDKVAILGMGCSKFGERWDSGAEELMLEAYRECLKDAGIDQNQLQAAWFSTAIDEVHVGKSGIPLSTTLRLPNIPVTHVENMCASGTEAFRGACYAVASGMAAVFGALACQLKAGDHLVASKALFGSCYQIVTSILPRFGIKTTLVDGKDLKAWKDAITSDTKCVFLETPSNPGLEVIDLEAVCAIAKAKGANIVVDNIFATPILQRPLSYGADVIVYSGTKHMDGQGRVLGGAIMSTKKFKEEQLKPFLRHTGPSISPFNAWVLLKGLETMKLRVEAQSHAAHKVAQALEAMPGIARVLYPHLDSHPQAALCRKQMTLGGTMVTFEVAGGKKLVVTDETRAAMRKALADIQTGEYAKSFILESRAGAPTLLSRRRLMAEHSIEVVGEKLRAMMPWIKANKLVDKSRN